MPVNATLATYSDYAFHAAVGIYLLAMLLYLAEYARARVPAPPAARVSVAAGAGTDGLTETVEQTTEPPTPDVPAESGSAIRRPWSERCGRMAVSLTILAALIHVGSLAVRGLAVGRWPWGNMYEFISAVCLMAVLTWLMVLRRTPALRPLGAFVLLPVEVLLFLAGSALYVKPAPVMPALQSYWLIIHVTAASVSSGLFLVAGVTSALFLVRRSAGGNSEGAGAMSRLPDSDTLDRVAYRVTVIALPIWTFAVMTGAIWAESAWGKFWSWDPKETVALVAWIVYAAYLHARATAGWRRGGAAWVNVAGFVVMVFNLFFINLVTTGMHSYAGL